VDVDGATGGAAATTDDIDAERPKRRGPGCGCWIALLVFLLIGGGVSAFIGGTTVLRTENPLPGEEFVTDLGIRWLAVPGEYADRRIPRKDTITVAKGQELFGVQCAFCHGQGGRGDAALGAQMYPRAANLTASRTQTKSDGQIYWLIAHGVNLTGMPAFGTDFGGGMSEDDLWSLVSYVRELGKSQASNP
jgi:mono/diheme cytochrome c family protein